MPVEATQSIQRQGAVRLDGAGAAPVGIYSGAGAPSGAPSGGETVALYIRNDAPTTATLLYVTRDSGSTWVAATIV
jgi:hypothetical protein